MLRQFNASLGVEGSWRLQDPVGVAWQALSLTYFVLCMCMWHKPVEEVQKCPLVTPTWPFPALTCTLILLFNMSKFGFYGETKIFQMSITRDYLWAVIISCSKCLPSIVGRGVIPRCSWLAWTEKKKIHREVKLITGYKCGTCGNFLDFPLLNFADLWD